MRILHVLAAPFPAPLGSQLYAGALCRALARRGHHVTLACYGAGAGPGPEGVELVRGRRVPGGDFRASGPHWSRLAHDLALGRALRRAHRARRFDVVHAHNVEAPVIARAALPRVPLIYGQHTAMAEELPAWFPLRGARRLGAAVDALVPRLSTASVALSEAGLPSLPTGSLLAPPGVDLEELDGADAARARARYRLDGRPWVVYAGNADPYQDLDRWLIAMRDLPEAGALLVTGGEAAPWEALGARLGLADRLVVHGGADFRSQLDALAAATAAVIPRRACAGFPMKLLNQLGLGVPTVCAPGSARPIAGVVVAAGDEPEHLAAALQALLADPQRRAALAAAARADVAARWTWDRRAADMEAVYARVLGRAG